MRQLSLAGAVFAFLLGMSGLALAQGGRIADDDLYKAETIVTGTGEEERLRGFKVGVEEAVVKLTGQASLLGSPKIAAIAERAAELVADYSYEDRMKGIPIHDEQGTRDRPHFLRIRFDKARFDEALRTARLEKWQGERPLTAIWLGVREARGRYVLSREGPEGYGQREVLKDASVKRGVPIVLPEPKQPAVTFETIDKRLWPVLQDEAMKLGADAVLYGLLEFDGNVGWNVSWTLAGRRAYAKWSMRGVSFDIALKSAIERCAAEFAKTAPAQ